MMKQKRVLLANPTNTASQTTSLTTVGQAKDIASSRDTLGNLYEEAVIEFQARTAAVQLKRKA